MLVQCCDEDEDEDGMEIEYRPCGNPVTIANAQGELNMTLKR